MHAKPTLLLPLLLLFSFACGSRTRQFEPVEVSANEPDPASSLDQGGRFHMPEERVRHVVQRGESSDNTGSPFSAPPPIVIYKASMFNELTTSNPVLVKFTDKGDVVAVQRMLVVVCTDEELEKKIAEAAPDDRVLELIFMHVRDRNLDMRKPADRIALIEEVTQQYGMDKARALGVRIYEGDWKLRYRWPALAGK